MQLFSGYLHCANCFMFLITSAGYGFIFISVGLGRSGWKFKYAILKTFSVFNSKSIACEIAPKWMSLDLNDNEAQFHDAMRHH